MKNTDILNRINALLAKKVKLASETLADGSVIEADAFEVGADIFLVDGGNKKPLAVGEYILANGDVLSILEVGKIGEISNSASEVIEEVDAKEELAEEPIVEEEKMADVPSTLEEVLAAVMESIKPMIDDLQAKIDAMAEAHSNMKEKLSATVVSKTTHKPSNGKVALSNVNKSSTEARIMAMLS